MVNQKVFEIGCARNQPTQESGKIQIIRSLPAVPVLSETLLLMELMVRQRCVDLTQVSGLIFSDLGATLQVLRLAGCEGSFPPDSPYRIEDCISDLGVDRCLEAMARCTLSRSTRHSALLAFWTHAREISNLCATVAQQISEDLNPEDACLVGLCHELGVLPTVLAWDCSLPADKDRAALKIAHAWRLPSSVLQYFSNLLTPGASNRWSEVVDRAHQLAGSSWPQPPEYGHVGVEADSWAGLQVASSWN